MLAQPTKPVQVPATFCLSRYFRNINLNLNPIAGAASLYIDGVLTTSGTLASGGVSMMNIAEFLHYAGYGNDKQVASIEVYQRVLSTVEVNEAMAKSTTVRVGKPLL